MHKSAVYFIIILTALLICGCTPTRLKIRHDSLQSIENKKQGNILVRQFVDKRQEPQALGDIRNRFGLEVGRILPENDVRVAALLTNYFAEALNAAGYQTVVQTARSDLSTNPAAFDAIIEGEIVVFWMDLHEKIQQNIEIRTRALDPTGKTVLWSKAIRTDRSVGVWWGTTDEYEHVLNEALTKALNEAAKEYASDDFYKMIKK